MELQSGIVPNGAPNSQIRQFYAVVEKKEENVVVSVFCLIRYCLCTQPKPDVRSE